MSINATEILEQLDVEYCLVAMATQLETLLRSRKREDYYIVGIQTGGLWLADRFAQLLKTNERPGSLNISFYRDDFSQNGLLPTVKPSDLNFSVDNAHVILVDDVLMSGRTIRAALNELFDFGRPLSVTLVVLVDLQAHALPIQPDVCGVSLKLNHNQRVKLTGPNPLALTVKDCSPCDPGHDHQRPQEQP